MHFSRISRRKKRLLPLRRLRAKPKAPPAMSWRCPTEDAAAREIKFYRGCHLLHTSFCGCGDFINHLLRLHNLHGDSQQDPELHTPVIRRALALPAAPESWRGDGGGAAAPRGGGPGGDGGDYEREDLDALYDAVAADQE